MEAVTMDLMLMVKQLLFTELYWYRPLQWKESAFDDALTLAN